MERQFSSEDSQQQDLSELAEDSEPQDLGGELDEDSQLKDITEQDEDSRSQDPNEQSKGESQIDLDTAEPRSWEEETPISGSWEKTGPGGEDNTSSFVAPEPSRSSHLSSLSSDTGLEDTQDLAWTEVSPETSELLSAYETFPSSLWEDTRTEWTFERPGHPIPRQKLSFHSYCCNSAIEETIKHSPRKLPKSCCLRGFLQKQAPKTKKREVIFPARQKRKRRIPFGSKRKDEYKAFFKALPHVTSSCERSDCHLGRKSKALYNLYTTFCDEEVARPDFLHRAEGYPAALGLSRACTIFSNLKKGRINVSNLLLTLHMLRILISREDMHRSLKYIAVDERGNLNLLEFLNVISLTTSFSGTKALQNARQVFRTLKKDMVAVKDLEPTLACLGVTLSPFMIEQALSCIHSSWDGKVNITKFLSAVREMQSCCEKTAYLDEYPALNWSSFEHGNDTDNLELRWRRTYSPGGREMPAYQAPIITFCSAEEAIVFTELQKQKSKPHRPVDLKRPNAAAPTYLPEEEEEEERKGIMRWPNVRSRMGYTSQDTLFPLESTLCMKGYNKKKKRLSFSDELPGKYSVKDSRVPNAAQLKAEDNRSTEDPPAQQPTIDTRGKS